MKRRHAIAVAVAVWLAVASAAAAHGIDPSILDVRALADGRVDVRWTEPTGIIDGPGLQFTPAALRVDFPEHCHVTSARMTDSAARGLATRWSLDCGAHGLDAGAIRVPGLVGSAKLVILRLRVAGQREPQVVLLTGRSDSFPLAATTEVRNVLSAPASTHDRWRGLGQLVAGATLAAFAVLGRKRGWLAWLLLVALLWTFFAATPFALRVAYSDAGSPSIHWDVAAPGLAVLAAWCARRTRLPVEGERASEAAARALVLLVPVVVPLAEWSESVAWSPWIALSLPVAMLAGALVWLATTSVPRVRWALAYAAGVFAAIETALVITS